jgi:acyl carrier protein
MEILTEQLIEIFEIDEISPKVVLRDLELWDSLSVISLLAVLDETYGINIEATELVDVVTVADLFLFTEQRRTK